jgi:hypothetical protein
MAGDFDPYYTWLGIPPDEQPPDAYSLLGLRRFEADADVIANSADRQMAHLRTYAAGKRGPFAEKLLNEVSAARVRLLNKVNKAEYDGRLAEEIAARTPPEASPPSAAPARVIPLARARPLADDSHDSHENGSAAEQARAPKVNRGSSAMARQRQKGNPVALIAAGAILAGGLAIAAILVIPALLSSGSPKPTADAGPSTRQPARAAVAPAGMENAGIADAPNGGASDAAPAEVPDTVANTVAVSDPASAAPPGVEVPNPFELVETVPPNNNPPGNSNPQGPPNPSNGSNPPTAEPAPIVPLPAAPPAATPAVAGLPSALKLPPLPKSGITDGSANPPATLAAIGAMPAEGWKLALFDPAELRQGWGRYALRPVEGLVEPAAAAWDVLVRPEKDNGSANRVVARFAIENQELSFAWAEQAAAEPLAAGLINCFLEFTTTGKSHAVPLRTSVTIKPMDVSFGKTGTAAVAELEHLPAATFLKVEITSVEHPQGAPQYKFEPGPQISLPKGASSIVLYEQDGNKLTLQVEAVLGTRGIHLSGSPYLQTSADPKPKRITPEALQLVIANLSASRDQLRAAYDAVDKEIDDDRGRFSFGKGKGGKGGPSFDPSRFAKERLSDQLRDQRRAADKALAEAQAVQQVMASLDGAAKIHYRVYQDLGSLQADLARTSSPTPTLTPAPTLPAGP